MVETEHLWTSLRLTFASDKPAGSLQDAQRGVLNSAFVQEPSDETRASLLRAQNENGCEEPMIPPSTGQVRLQLRQRSLDLLVGGRACSRSCVASSIVRIGDKVDQDVSAIALDALYVAVIATYASDRRLVMTSRALYVQAVCVLGGRIKALSARAPTSRELNDVSSATYTLTVCALFECVGADKNDWLRYSTDLSNVMQQHGLASIDTSLQKAWLEKALYSGLAIGQRRISQPAPPQGNSDEERAVESFAWTVAELLEETAELIKTSKTESLSQRAIILHLTKLGRAMAVIKKAHLDLAAEMPFPYRVTGLQTFKDFDLFQPRQSTTFTLAYHFDLPQREAKFRLGTLCLLEIDQAIMEIHSANSVACSDTVSLLQYEMARQDAKEAADSLCMLVPGCVEPDNGLARIVSSLPLLLVASRFYRKHGYEEQLDWCLKVMDALRSRYGVSANIMTEHEPTNGKCASTQR